MEFHGDHCVYVAGVGLHIHMNSLHLPAPVVLLIDSSLSDMDAVSHSAFFSWNKQIHS